MKKKKIKLHEIDLEQDIRYRGPLSYRHFRILGWLCLAASQVLMLLNLVQRFKPDMMAEMNSQLILLSVISSMSVPFLLFANYATILDYTEGYKRQLIFNGSATLLIIGMFLLIYNRYVLGIVSAFISDSKDPGMMIESSIQEHTASGYQAFNLFIDLVLCTLFMFFLNYRPKRLFRGKKLIVFRLFALLPVLYEAASVVLKLLAAIETIRIPVNLYPFLTVKPPIMFLVFLILALYIKNRERRFCRFGRTHKEYMAFIKTKRNSFQFSRFAAALIAGAGLFDLMLLNAGIYFMNSQIENASGIVTPYNTYQELNSLGIGNSSVLLVLAPFMLLFSYTRTYKNKLLDLLIPVLGIVLIIFVYLEGAFQAAQRLPMILGS